eukprot:TRINITY_DN16986_c0_g1_i2.p2 TRINITY_DN16986_c0_g1~~TRINITY_DN16986_c0_g1_i2.p2  ORF type:complete len:250 (+),score=103.48 TRINITY_DN16986_c0_g1_i2:50-751(+)
MASMDFYFDYSSPWTYLAFLRIQELVAEYAARGAALRVEYKPILVGAVFNTTNPSVYEMRKRPVLAKARYGVRDMKEWCEAYGVAIRDPYGPTPPDPFPVNSAKALRGGLYALSLGDTQRFLAYSHRVFEAYWVEGRDISAPDVLGAVAADAKLDAAAFSAYVASDAAKAALRANTDELIKRGGFGSPTMFVGGAMFFGNDRVVLAQRRIDMQLKPRSATGAATWAWHESAKL